MPIVSFWTSGFPVSCKFIDPFSRYDVAISTACGPLDNIVVDTVDTAQSCIAYLKSSGVGSATFICLDKQQHLVHQAREAIRSWPEDVPRLFDLVRVNNEDLLPAFYFALRDTLVAKDMDQATRIAYGARRYRVVTLTGGIIEASGAMSGEWKKRIVRPIEPCGIRRSFTCRKRCGAKR